MAAKKDQAEARELAVVTLTDPDGAKYGVTSPAELYNLLSRGYSLPRGTDEAEAAERLAGNVGGEPAASTATVSTGTAPASGSSGAA
jgi:hypothetical protein